jgi:hypothetical protein
MLVVGSPSWLEGVHGVNGALLESIEGLAPAQRSSLTVQQCQWAAI